MKLILKITLSIFWAAGLVHVDCGSEPMSGRHIDTTTYTPIDTLHIKHLTAPITIPIKIKAYEFDTIVHNIVPLAGATVRFLNTGTFLLTDTDGIAKTKFTVDSIPYKYGYSITKTGYNLIGENIWDWDTATSIERGITLTKINGIKN